MLGLSLRSEWDYSTTNDDSHNWEILLLRLCFQGDQIGIAPQMFKALVGRGHPEFSTNRQQDAQEFLLHFINMVEVKYHSHCIFLFVCLFFGLFQHYWIDTMKRGQESGGKEKGEDMWRGAAGRTRIQAGRSQPCGMWSPAQSTELKSCTFTFFPYYFVLNVHFLHPTEKLPLWVQPVWSLQVSGGGADCVSADTEGQIHTAGGLHRPAARAHGPGYQHRWAVDEDNLCNVNI